MARIMVFLFLLLAGCATGKAGVGTSGGFERQTDGARVSFAEMVADLRGNQIIFVGELHNEPRHHRLQLEIIKALHGSGVRIALAFEMFKGESQPLLDRWIAGKMDLLDFMAVYRENWTLPWELYDSLFLYARNNRIPMLALNASDMVMQKAYRMGMSGLGPEELRLLPPNVTCTIDDAYLEFIRRNYVWHTTDEAMFYRFSEAQQLRDKVMAYRIVNFIRQKPDRVVVVLSGVGHSLRRGVPNEAAKLAPLRMKIVIPKLSGVAADPLKDGGADYVEM
jgi:uncharacterized iron-regulated protein